MRKFAFALIFSIFFSILNFSYAQAEEKIITSTDIELLQTLGIFEKDIVPTDFVTRGEFADIVAHSINVSGSAEVNFTDISPTHKYYKSVSSITSIGYMKPNIKGAFLVDVNISKKNVAIVLVKVLGFNFPNYSDEDYFALALNQGILNGLKNFDENITKSELALVVKKTIESPLNKIVSAGDSKKYEQHKDVTILTEYHNIYKGRDIFKSIYFTAINPIDAVRQNEAKIGNDIVTADYEKFAKYVGFKVDYYYYSEKNSEDKSLIYVTPLKSNDSISIQLSDVTDVEISSNYYTIKYGNDQKIKMSRFSDVIYNNEFVSDYNIQSLSMILNGTATFINNNGEYYNLLKIEEFNSNVVVSVNAEAGKIFIKNSSTPLIIPIDNNKAMVTILDKEGFGLNISNLKEWYVLTTMQSISGNYTRVIVTNDKVSGTVTETSIEDKGSYICIDGDKYPVHINGFYGAKAVGDLTSGVFLLNSFGDVVGMNTSLEVRKYGYITKVAETTGVDAKYMIRIFNEKGKFENFVIADKLKFNNVSTTASAIMSNPLLFNGNSLKPQLIKYVLNKNMEIKELYTATDNSAVVGYQGYDINNFTKDYVTATPGFYRTSNRILDNRYIISGSSVMILAPSDVTAEDDFSILTPGMYKIDITGLTGWQIFDSNEFKEPSVILVPGGTVNYEKDLLIVSKVRRLINAKGDEAIAISGYLDGKEVEFEVQSALYSTVASVKTGDVLRINLLNGRISTFAYMFQSTNYLIDVPEFDYIGGGKAWWSELVTVCGEVNKKNASSMTLKVNGQPTPLVYSIAGNTAVYKYDKNRNPNTLTKASLSDIFETARVFVHRKNDQAQFILILPE